MRGRLQLGLCGFVIVASLLLGGGARGGFLSDAILQLLAVPCLLYFLWQFSHQAAWREHTKELAFCAALLAVPLVQLIPLPPFIWKSLPNRDLSAAALDLIGAANSWAPMSVSPRSTWLSALGLIPPLAVFIGMLQLPRSQRRTLSLLILLVGVVSVFLGLLQLAQGPNSSLRFFAYTNVTEAVGFFANRNHFAALLYALTLIAAAWAINSAFSAGTADNQSRFDAAHLVPLIASFTVLAMLVSAQAMARSRAGLGLTIVALLGSLALTLRQERGASSLTPIKLITSATALALVFSAQYALYRIMDRFAADPLADARVGFARNTITAAKASMPFGTGMGTFVPVYAVFEKTEDTMVNTFANHAHNDVLELWLETGVAGIILMVLFLIWFLQKTRKAWARGSNHAQGIDQTLARAATLVIALLIAHSFVDYPLRTGGMMAILAFACALLSEAPPDPQLRPAGAKARIKRAPGPQQPQAAPSGAPSAAPEHETSPFAQPRPTVQSEPGPDPTAIMRGRWGKDIEWPEAWQKPSQQGGEAQAKSPKTSNTPDKKPET